MLQTTAAPKAANAGRGARPARDINLIGGSAYSTTGGIQAVNRRLVRELDAAEWLRCAHFLWDDPEAVTEEGRNFATRGRAVFYRHDRKRMLGNFLRQAWRFSPDRWLCTHVNYALLGLAASGWRPQRVGVILHAAELDGDLSTMRRFALCRAGFIIAVSEYTKSKAIKVGVPESRIHVLLHGVDDACPMWRADRVTAQNQRVLFVGRMDEHYKGQAELIEALVLLRRRVPRVTAVFVGGGRSLDHWRAHAQHRGVGSLIEFKGEISDAQLAAEYAAAALLVMPSENEGFGLVYAEAMAHGIPCIGSDRDAAREVISDGETGFCIPAHNATALADAILVLLTTPELRTKMAHASRERFVAFFSAEKYRERLRFSMAEWSAPAR